MKKLKKLSGKTLKFISGGFDVQSECTTLCSDGRIASVTCNGDCSSSDGIGQDAVMVRTHITVQNRKMKQKILIIIKVYSILMKKSIQIWLLLGTIYIHAQYFRFEYELNCITDTISN
ncbi:hypothetical protein [Elizabethkingia meningoseptica]|uniref:hypothetical protein n=1 Tax=Elizabethkingia meningoseptica TaxID=238 RepID=UPI0038929745